MFIYFFPPEITSEATSTEASSDDVFYALAVAVSVVGGVGVVIVIAILLVVLAVIMRRRRNMSLLPQQPSLACHMTDYTIKTKGSQLSCSSTTSTCTNSSLPSGDLPLNTDLLKYLGTSV